MLLGKFDKQPAEIEVYGVTYTDATDFDETLLTATASVVDLAGVASTMTLSPCTISDKNVRVQASAGTDGAEYKITIVVDTSTGRRMEDELIIRVKEV